MGTIYKIKPQIVNFIISNKHGSPDLSCRKIAEIVSKKFNIKLSKSSVNSIIKNNQLSSPVGRRTLKRIQIQGEIDHGGFSILQGVDSYFTISSIITELIVNKQLTASKELFNDTKDVVQALIIFKAIFDLNIENRRCYDNHEIWTLVGRRPTRSVYNRIFNSLESSQLTANDIVTEMRRQLVPMAGFRFILRDNTSFFIDGQLQSIWKLPIKNRELSTTYYKSISYINEFIKEELLLPVFNVQGTDIYSQEILNFISALNGENLSKTIKQIELLDVEGNVLETKVVSNTYSRLFLLGLWPWQLDRAAEFERKPAKNKLPWRDLGTELYYQIEEISLSQHLVAQHVKYNIILLKNNPIGPVRMGILTNMPEDIIHNYLSINWLYHWIDPENSYKSFTKKTQEANREAHDLLIDTLISLPIIKEENNLENIFSLLSQLVFNFFQKKFLPYNCSSWNQLKIKDVFLRQKAEIKRTKEFIYHNILISNELCKDDDINYICQRLNDNYIINRWSKFSRFTFSPKSS